MAKMYTCDEVAERYKVKVITDDGIGFGQISKLNAIKRKRVQNIRGRPYSI